MASIAHQASGLRECVRSTSWGMNPSTSHARTVNVCMAPCRTSKPSLSIRHAHQRRRASVTTNSANPGSAVETTEAAVEGAVETVKEKVEEAASTVKEVVAEGVEEVAKVIPNRGVLERCERFRASRGGNLKADPLRIIMFQVHVHLNAICALFPLR